MTNQSRLCEWPSSDAGRDHDADMTTHVLGLADFVILIQRLGTQGWDEVERFDCCHGHCHLHPDGQAESETLYQLDGPDDVQEAYAKASVYAGERARIIRDKGGE